MVRFVKAKEGQRGKSERCPLAPHTCIRCGTETTFRFYADPFATRSTSEPCCEPCCHLACGQSITDHGLRFYLGLAWLRAEGRRTGWYLARKPRRKGGR
jgi:hypothetical protein